MASYEKQKVFGVEHVNFCIARAGAQWICITSIFIGITISKGLTRADDAHFNFPNWTLPEFRPMLILEGLFGTYVISQVALHR